MSCLGKNIAFIPVRGGSKSIPMKNIRPMHGRPLIYWALDAAVGCRRIDCVVVSTESEEIAEKVRAYGSNKIMLTGRSEEVSTDTASTESVMLEFAERYDFETIALIQATSPLLRVEDLELGFSRYEELEADSVFSAVRQKRFLWGEGKEQAVPLNYDPLHRPRRQEFSGQLVENGAFYITNRKRLLETRCRISGRIFAVEMPESSYFEIDEPEDWELVEFLLKRQQRCEPIFSRKLEKIRCVLTDCDGVLTDGGMYYSEFGDELKKFNTRDGKGFQLLRDSGLITGIITGEDVKIVHQRGRKLLVDELHTGVSDKKEVLRQICERRQISFEEVLFIGDDINDMEVLKMAGFGCAVSDAEEVVKEAADYVTRSGGGRGAFREVAEMVIMAQKHGDSNASVN